MKWRVPRILIAAAAAVVAAASPAVAAVPRPATPAAEPGACQALHIPVALSAGAPSSQTVWALYCTPLYHSRGRPPIDITVPGATYNHDYFAAPVKPWLYNFTDQALLTGQAVLAYDRLGTGQSSHPVSTDLTITSDAYVLHQVIAWARDAAGYTTVNVIGHSVGSAVAAQDAVTWPGDPTRLVLTGFLNNMSPATPAALANDIYPADDDPAFAGDGLDPGYLTTVPGVRQSLFYAAGADPAVIAWDEAHKDLASASEFAQFVPIISAPPATSITSRITVPVLVMVGELDALTCGGAVDCTDPAAVRAYEAPYFSASPALTVTVIPGTGHDLALNPTAVLSFGIIRAWLGNS